MDKKTKELIELIRQLVSDVQGAPYPGEFEPELYQIWYEHVQRNAQNCFEYLNDNFEVDKKEFNKTLDKMFK
ncbi:MAG: hypothetical protein J6Z17_06130 [Treponema sp.]|nr:hypothetical protein [Treponema sp.]